MDNFILHAIFILSVGLVTHSFGLNYLIPYGLAGLFVFYYFIRSCKDVWKVLSKKERLLFASSLLLVAIAIVNEIYKMGLGG